MRWQPMTRRMRFLGRLPDPPRARADQRRAKGGQEGAGVRPVRLAEEARATRLHDSLRRLAPDAHLQSIVNGQDHVSNTAMRRRIPA